MHEMKVKEIMILCLKGKKNKTKNKEKQEN